MGCTLACLPGRVIWFVVVTDVGLRAVACSCNLYRIPYPRCVVAVVLRVVDFNILCLTHSVHLVGTCYTGERSRSVDT